MIINKIIEVGERERKSLLQAPSTNFQKSEISPQINMCQTPNTDYDKPTFLISLERMKIDLYVAEISQILKLISVILLIHKKI